MSQPSLSQPNQFLIALSEWKFVPCRLSKTKRSAPVTSMYRFARFTSYHLQTSSYRLAVTRSCNRGHTARPHPQFIQFIKCDFWGWGLSVWPLCKHPQHPALRRSDNTSGQFKYRGTSRSSQTNPRRKSNVVHPFHPTCYCCYC